MNSMLAQIHSLPALLRDSFDALDDAARTALDADLCRRVTRLYVTGCGDSHHAALETELAFEALAGIPTQPMTAMQFARYAAPALPRDETNLVVGISVSGEVTRTLEGLLEAKKRGAVT